MECRQREVERRLFLSPFDGQRQAIVQQLVIGQAGQRIGHFFGGDVPLALEFVSGSRIADLIPLLHSLVDELLGKTLVEHYGK